MAAYLPTHRLGDEDWQSPVWQVAAASVAYLLGVVVLIRFMRHRDRMELKWCKVAYNAFMSVYSLWLFWGSSAVLLQNVSDNGSRWSLAVCDNGMVLRRRMGHWFYWFYVSKFVEYADTVFLIFGKKYGWNVGWYLQVWHHFVTASVAWVAWFYPTPSFFMGLSTNTFVHIVMYAYFALAVALKGTRFDVRRFGHLVTYVQLTQFWYCVFLGWFIVLVLMPSGCTGSQLGALYIISVYSSFLFFFLAYWRERKARKPRPNGAVAKQD